MGSNNFDAKCTLLIRPICSLELENLGNFNSWMNIKLGRLPAVGRGKMYIFMIQVAGEML